MSVVHLFSRTPLYYGQFTWSLRDRNPYKAYLSKTDTSIIRTLTHSCPLGVRYKQVRLYFLYSGPLSRSALNTRQYFNIDKAFNYFPVSDLKNLMSQIIKKSFIHLFIYLFITQFKQILKFSNPKYCPYCSDELFL